MNNEEEKRCPLCAEEMDWTDQQLNPCKCGYEVCVWCWHHIMDMAEKDATEGRCPACRTPYDKDRIVGLEAKFERVAGNGSGRKQKLSKAKPKTNEGKKDLSNVRVIQRKMAYIIGLPLDLADEELLQRKDYFGQYGRVTKVSLSRTSGGAVQQFINDTCSVYITYSKEEEAVICIQSVHGYVLDGRLLRASFGTAKYCHAWLRNTPCNNPTCLYLHTVGAEEDSFGKDEVAAVHTRNRVQEIVGGTRYLHRRSGSMLPPSVIEQVNIHSDFAEEHMCENGVKEVAYPLVASCDHLSCSKEKDVTVRSSNHTATFVDIVGRSCSSVSEKDVISVERADSNRDESTKEQSSMILSDSPSFDDLRSKDSIGSSHMGSVVPSYPVKTSKNYSDHSWWDSEFHGQISAVHDTILSANTNSVVNDGYNDSKFQSSVKSDRIYRCSNSFSNEDIVEHLRRLDDDENSAAVENSIISDILSMDLDGSDNSAFPQKVAGLFEGRDGLHGSLRNFQNIDQSRFSFANEYGQQNVLGSPSNVGKELSFSVLQDSFENKDYLYKSQHHATRAPNLTPPGFSMPSKPPPGFSSSMRTEQVVSATSGSYFRAAPTTHYRSSSLGNLSNSSDELVDPYIMVGGGKSSTIGSTNSWTSSFSSRCSSPFDGHHRQDPQFSLPTMQQHYPPQFPSSQDNLHGGLTSGLADINRQRYNPSLFTQQMKGYQQHDHLQEAQEHDPRSEVERFGLESFLPGYGDSMFQMPTSGDVYTRVFGM